MNKKEKVQHDSQFSFEKSNERSRETQMVNTRLQRQTSSSQFRQSPEPKPEIPHLKRTYTQVRDDHRGQQEVQDKLAFLHQHTIIIQQRLPGIDLITNRSLQALFGGFILLVLSGLALCVGAVIPYMVSLYRLHLKYDVNYDTFQPMQALTEILAAVSFPISNYMIDHVFSRHSRPVIFIGGILGLSLLYYSVALHVDPHIFVFMYSAGNGIIKGFYKQASLVAGWSHLGGRKGLVSGVILSGYGIGGALFSLYYNMRVDELGENPKLDKKDGNMYFPEVVGERYPRIHKEACLGMAALTGLSMILISNYAPKKIEEEDGDSIKNSFIDMPPAKRERLNILLREEDLEYIRKNVSRSVCTLHEATNRQEFFSIEQESEKEVSEYVEQIERNFDLELRAEAEISILTIMRSNKFLLIFFMSIFQLMYPLYFDVVFKEIAQFYIKDDETLTMIGSIAFSSNSVVKFLVGLTLEYIPCKTVNWGIITVMLVTILTLQQSMKNWITYMIASILIMGCEGAYVTLQAVITMQQFGLKRGPEVYAYMLSAQAVASLTTSLLVLTIKIYGGQYLMFLICFIGIICGAVCNYIIDDRTMVKYGDLYYENIGIIGGNMDRRLSDCQRY